MKNYKGLVYPVWSRAARLLAILLLVCPAGAHATAPRITAELFGEEKKVDIAAYQVSVPDAGGKSEGALVVDIVMRAFNAAGKTPALDVLPSRQLAIYALFNNDVQALIGSPQDIAEKYRNQYRMVVFYLRADEPVALIFSNRRGRALHKSFVDGMHKILRSGEYVEIFEKYHISPGADYMTRLKRQNPDWK
ncbi:MAG: hypothetical protein PHP85_11300 [Gallionella sp.]|nr:hypothetical protein [Gallionella sp.]